VLGDSPVSVGGYFGATSRRRDRRHQDCRPDLSTSPRMQQLIERMGRKIC
jgi:hypothetical protein